MFKITVFRKSSNEKSYVVGVRTSVVTPFGTSEANVGVGYIKAENEIADGTVINWNGNVQFQPIVDRDGLTATTQTGEVKHQVVLVSSDLPFIAPTTVKPLATASRPAVIEEPEMSHVDEDGDPLNG